MATFSPRLSPRIAQALRGTMPPWFAIGAAAAALVLLLLYVLTLQASVQRGETLRAEQRQSRGAVVLVRGNSAPRLQVESPARARS